MIFRPATAADIDGVCLIYDGITTLEAEGTIHIGWIKDVYPARKTALEALEKNELFVAEDNGRIVATGIINHKFEDKYKSANWLKELDNSEFMVLHTLCVLPSEHGKGIASRFVEFYEQYSRDMGAKSLRLDTFFTNTRARSMYPKLGFTEIGTAVMNYGSGDVTLVLFEKLL